MRLSTIPKRGFTAVEIAAVATIIAILALLILPIFRQRTEDARRVAADDELQSLVKAIMLVEADMPAGNFLPRLNDLDNRANPQLATIDPTAQDLAPPRVRWIRGTEAAPGSFEPVSEPEYFNSVVPNWRGPYIALRRAISLAQLQDQFPLALDTAQGPIAIIPEVDGQVLNQDRYPVDPWGSPYLLFGPDETIYNTRVLYSVGPDGLPGGPETRGGEVDNPAFWDRRTGVLGTGDDLFFIF